VLRGKLIHPGILEALGRAGHSARVLIADGNYPFSTKSPKRAALVSLNLSPGVVDSVQVLEAVASAVPFEACNVMAPATEGPYALAGDPPVWDEFRRVLAGGPALEPLERFDFYAAASAADVALVIATGEQRIYANLLLTIGVVMDE
jgi:L-fucose mutarotase